MNTKTISLLISLISLSVLHADTTKPSPETLYEQAVHSAQKLTIGLRNLDFMNAGCALLIALAANQTANYVEVKNRKKLIQKAEIKLQATETELKATETELKAAQTELKAAQTELKAAETAAKPVLQATETELQAAQTELELAQELAEQAQREKKASEGLRHQQVQNHKSFHNATAQTLAQTAQTKAETAQTKAVEAQTKAVEAETKAQIAIVAVEKATRQYLQAEKATKQCLQAVAAQKQRLTKAQKEQKTAGAAQTLTQEVLTKAQAATSSLLRELTTRTLSAAVWLNCYNTLQIQQGKKPIEVPLLNYIDFSSCIANNTYSLSLNVTDTWDYLCSLFQSK